MIEYDAVFETIDNNKSTPIILIMLKLRKPILQLLLTPTYPFTTASSSSYSSSTSSSSSSSTSSSSSSSSKKKNHYQMLQVPISATQANIKQNYLRLAKIYHPDVYKGKDKDRFQNIQQAYQVLSDRLKRAQYDQTIGLAPAQSSTTDGANEGPEGQNFRGKEDLGKPENPMNYGDKSQNINFQQQFNKFFSQKPKTQFQQIRITEQAQIRSMSQSQRVRRHFRNVYESAQALNKTDYQKQFTTILNDQIDQQNRMHDQHVGNLKREKELNSEKVKRKFRYGLFIGFGIFFVSTMPLIYSYVTKYQLEKEVKDRMLEKMKKKQEKTIDMDLRFRLKYEK